MKKIGFLRLKYAGQGTVEYAMIVIAVVAVVVAVVMRTNNPFKTAMQGAFNKMGNKINNATGAIIVQSSPTGS